MQNAESGRQNSAFNILPSTFDGLQAPFILEIGTEELPSGDLEDALAQLKAAVPAMLEEQRLDHGVVQILGTPRRLVVSIDDLAPAQPDREDLVKGPPASRAFDSAGAPTKAAEGFARSKGLQPSDLEVREIEGGEYVVAVVSQKGRSTPEILIEQLPQLIAGLSFGKSMRWNFTNVAFSRPIRWLLALYGEAVIPFEYAGLRAGATTRGLRFIEPLEISVSNPAEYFAALEKQGIILDPEDRKAKVEEQINNIALDAGGEIHPDPDLLTEVTHLVEAPTAIIGEFNPRHLELPREVLIAVMKKHQRYFPIHKGDDLLPKFVIVANKPSQPCEGYEPSQGLPEIKLGNEDVVRARFADAAYFVKEDLQTPLDDFVPQLDKLTFQADLGSMLDKTQRIGHLVGLLAPMVGLNPEETFTAARAAKLCKADLATQMVVEMTSLQGVIGRDYALAAGEPPVIAAAIFEHYQPRSASDSTPKSKPGLLVGLADRLDSLAGLFAAGLAPTGNKDPFAQRRAALGLVGNLIHWELDFDLRPALETAAENLPIEASPKSQAEALNFIIERLRNVLLDEGYRYDIVDAVVVGQGYNPAKAAQAVKELSAWVTRDDWDTILPAYSRCVRITRPLDEQFKVDPAAFVEPAAKALFAALAQAEAAERAPGSVNDFLNAFVPIIPAIDKFFEDVLVMDDDKKVRENRLALLQRIAALADGVADMSKLEGF
jgi:glycyl-tRNA synthetase